MRLNEGLFFVIILILIDYSNQQYLSLKTYETNHYQVNTGTWKDLLGVVVECPHGGVIKNFVLRKKNGYFWYEFQCYSSLDDQWDEGEPIIKGLTLYSTYRYSITIQENIRTLNQYPVECWIDYGLMAFYLYNDNGILRREAICHGLKSRYSTKMEIASSTRTALATVIDGLVDIVVGSTATEDNTNIAYPLRGFKYNIDASASREKPTVGYIYAYSILRNMKEVKQYYKETFENLRNGNTQKN